MKSKVSAFVQATWMCCCLQLDLVAQPTDYPSYFRFQHYGLSDGLPEEHASGVIQDSLGFLWIRGAAGISRYDGYDFKNYMDTESEGLGLSAIWGATLSVDRLGDLWVVGDQQKTSNHQLVLYKYDRRKDRFINYYPDLNGALLRGSVALPLCFEKSNSKIWVGTATPGRGLFRFDTETGETKRYLNQAPGSTNEKEWPSSVEERNAILSLSDKDSMLILATWKGLWKFDKTTEKFERPTCDPRDSAWLFNFPLWAIIESPSETNAMWLVDAEANGRSRGLVRINENFSIVHRFEFPEGIKGQITTVKLDKNGFFWISTFRNGLHRYNPMDSSLASFRNMPEDPYSLRSNSITNIAIDRDNNLWVTTSDHGISKSDMENQRFYNYDLGKEITSCIVYHENGSDFLVAGTGRRRVAQDAQHEIITARILDTNLASLNFTIARIDAGQGPIKLCKGRNYLWVSSTTDVIGLSVDARTGAIEPGPLKIIRPDPNNPNTISYENVQGVWEDPSSNLWVAMFQNGLDKVVHGVPYGTDGSVVKYRHREGDSSSLSDDILSPEFCIESQNSFWVITSAGVDLMRNGSFEHPFKNGYALAISKDSKGNILIGTRVGLYESMMKGNYSFRKIASPILNKYGVYAITEDGQGRLWITNPHGLICYDRVEQNAILFTKKDGIDFTHDWIATTTKGLVITANYKGISVFDPTSISVNRTSVSPVFTQLIINNKYPVIEGDSALNRGDNIEIEEDISVLDELILDYQHNNFAIEFSAMEMTAPEKNFYRHKLEGYDKDWIETDWRNRTATYTNLNAGSYVFKVRATNSHGIWSDHETTLSVRILPPPWKTWWAYTLYGLAFIAALLSWRHYENKRLKLKHHAEHLSELDSLKSQFFANISHEFRTPITLILGPLKELYNGTFTGDQKSALGVMMRNGQRLLRLINQLLDLSKLEAGKMQLHASSIDLVQFLKEIASSYESHAANKKIKFLFYPEVQQLLTYVDKEKIEKVIHNLLSNAFKFTRESGEIILYLKVQNKHAIIVIKDSGIGIPSEQVNRVFDRFYQVDNSLTRSYEGSGLGMALAKELIELHHGKISVESIEGRGTTFTVLLPLVSENLNKHGVVGPEPLRSHDYHDVVSMDETNVDYNNNPAAVQNHQPVVLIVEDNMDMRNYIRKTLSARYHIIEADNGKEGVKKAQETVPDLIISDIMMPEMDGYKLCEIIKTKELTCHIPVILLTAKADHESKLTGLETGADDYLSKPFDTDELKLIIRNRIEERRKMRERFSREVTLEPKQISITSLDEKFLIKVLAIIEDHMDDENFSIEDFSQEAGYSKIQFYRKIKALSGQSPSVFLRTIRLKRAADLLSKNSDNVSQIAYSVGFGSLSYFNKCFKEQFGVTPGQFAESNNAKKLESP